MRKIQKAEFQKSVPRLSTQGSIFSYETEFAEIGWEMAKSKEFLLHIFFLKKKSGEKLQMQDREPETFFVLKIEKYFTNNHFKT